MGRHQRETRQICGLRNEHAQGAGVDRIASWSKRLVDMLIKRAVMEGILRQAPRLSRPPAAEAGPLQVGWASCGCRAGPRIHAGSAQASRGSVGMVSTEAVGYGPGSGPGFVLGVGVDVGVRVGVVSDVGAAAAHLRCACERVMAMAVVV